MESSDLVRAARMRAGMTQSQLAQRSGVHQPSLSAIENGNLIPRRETLDRILRAARPRPSEALARRREEVRALAGRHKATDVRVFGSAVHGEDTPTSDLDLLITFADDASYFDAVGLRLDLEELLGCKVDIISDENGSRVVDSARADAVPV